VLHRPVGPVEAGWVPSWQWQPGAAQRVVAVHDAALFPGSMPGRPMNVDGLATNLRRIGVPVMATKTGAWQQLVREGPPTVLAEALGISPVTAMRHAQRASSNRKPVEHALPCRSEER
jgi:hypothetical protein